MQFLIVSLAFIGMTSGAVIYTNEVIQPTVYADAPVVVAPVALPPLSPEAQAAGDKLQCSLKALSESACKLAEGINCKTSSQLHSASKKRHF